MIKLLICFINKIMIPQLIGAALMGFALFLIFLSFELGRSDVEVIAIWLFCAVLLIGGYHLLMLPVEAGAWKLVIAALSTLFGIFMTFFYPTTYFTQSKFYRGMTHVGVLIGLTFLIFGIRMFF